MNDDARPEGPPALDPTVARRLGDAYDRVKTGTKPTSLAVGSLRIVVFSDHHRGVRDGADDFQRCEAAYNAALGYYLELGYTLVVLGDVEDLWECRPARVLDAYARTVSLEAAFRKAGGYVRVSGNHDDLWENADAVRSYLGLPSRYGPDVSVPEGLLAEIDLGSGRTGEIFFTHGHQGDWTSDRRSPFYRVSRFGVRYLWRPFQRLTGVKLTTPARSFELRDTHNIQMYQWALGQRTPSRPFVLVAGHTHAPVFASTDHVGLLEAALERSRQQLATSPAGAPDPALVGQIAERRADVESVRTRAGCDVPGSGLGEAVPCYFNTGCCSFSDGDVTGIELADGRIRLVRWPDDGGAPRRKVLEERSLGEVFQP